MGIGILAIKASFALVLISITITPIRVTTATRSVSVPSTIILSTSLTSFVTLLIIAPV